MKLKKIKEKITGWAKAHFVVAGETKDKVFEEIEVLDDKEEPGQFLREEIARKLFNGLYKKLKQEEFKWRQCLVVSGSSREIEIQSFSMA